MIALVSSPNDAGHVVVVRLPDGCHLRVDFIDEDDARDLTDWVADLVVLGLAVRHELDTDQTVEPAEEVEVCSITFDVLDPSASFTYLHLPSSRAVEMSVADAVRRARRRLGGRGSVPTLHPLNRFS